MILWLRMRKPAVKKTAQEMQDDIFRAMTVEKKMELAAGLWRLSVLIAGKKMKYETKRPPSAFSRAR